jgi:hypothetical protein
MDGQGQNGMWNFVVEQSVKHQADLWECKTNRWMPVRIPVMATNQ